MGVKGDGTRIPLTMTINLTQLTFSAPQPGHGALVTARLPFIATGNQAASDLAAAAQSAGMVQVAPNQFQHPLDGSWAILNGVRVDRGVGTTCFRGRVQDLLSLQVATGGPPCAAHAISPQTPAASVVAPLVSAGFTEISKNYWTHPDGSWVAVTPDAGILRGQNQSQFPANDVRTARVTPTPAAAPVVDVMALQARDTQPQDGNLAAIQASWRNHAELVQQGFVELFPGHFEHPSDNSWISFANPQTPVRGVGNIRLTNIHLASQNAARAVPTFDVMTLQTRNPQPQDANLASTTVGWVDPRQLASQRPQLVQMGFVESQPGYFEHPADNSWIAFTNTGTVERGVGNVRFNRMPARAQTTPSSPAAPAAPAAPALAVYDVMALQTVSPRFEDGFLACAMPGRLNGQAAAEGPQLVQQGFVEVHPGYFEHPGDNSWIAFTVRNTVERGVGNTRFSGVPLNPTRVTHVDPNATGQGFLLSAANPTVQALTLADVQTSDAALTAAGFTRAAGPHPIYTHADGCFLAFTATQTYVGQNQQIFSSMPRQLDAKNAIPSRMEHGFFAIANTANLQADSATLGQSLGSHGFTAAVTGVLYKHTDGSWVAVQNGILYRGVNADLLADVPPLPPPGSTFRDHSRPPLPSSMRGCGLANLGMVGPGNVDAQCIANGFIRMGQEYVHPDGCWVAVSGGGISVGWKGYLLGEMQSVYSNSRGGWV
jgi:hypothetical protein